MKTGMLWFDNDPKVDLQAKINRAADYYRKKYGTAPDLCFVHPSMVNTELPLHKNGIEVCTTKLVLPNHLWIGKHETPSAA